MIDDYQAGRCNLQHVNSQLESLIQALEGISDDLRHEFLERWAVLEVIVATKSAEGNGNADLSTEETLDIEMVLAEIRDAAQRRAEP